MRTPAIGHCSPMADQQRTNGGAHRDGPVEEHRDHPTANHPLHGERRPVVTPVLAVIGLVVAIGIVFAVVTWLRYTT